MSVLTQRAEKIWWKIFKEGWQRWSWKSKTSESDFCISNSTAVVMKNRRPDFPKHMKFSWLLEIETKHISRPYVNILFAALRILRDVFPLQKNSFLPPRIFFLCIFRSRSFWFFHLPCCGNIDSCLVLKHYTQESTKQGGKCPFKYHLQCWIR